MTKARKSYPSDVSDEEWAFCAPYLTLMREDAVQRDYSLRAMFNAVRGRGPTDRITFLNGHPDLGGVADEVKSIVDGSLKDLPKGSRLAVRGQIETMQSSFTGLLLGLIFAVVLLKSRKA